MVYFFVKIVKVLFFFFLKKHLFAVSLDGWWTADNGRLTADDSKRANPLLFRVALLFFIVSAT